MPAPPYRFLHAELHPVQRMLRIDGRDCQVGARAFDLLLALVERRDRVVTKSELLDLVWPNSVVEENNVQVHISSLRKLLGARAIATIPGRGYRFVAPLDDAADAGESERPARVPPSGLDPRERTSRTNLPAHRPVLIGRGDDLRHVVELLGAHRLLTLVGAGGIGKSRLAQAAAEAELESGRWPGGVWWIELSGIADPALLPRAVAQQLGLSLPEGDAGLVTLAASLHARRMLLVLDNCEHLLDDVATFAGTLLEAAPAVGVLATSQEPLRVPEEQQVRLEPLAVPRDAAAADARAYGAVALLESRVRAVEPRFEISDAELPVAIDLCRQLDGLPLAIELAAARVPVLGLRAVHVRMHERFQLFTTGVRTALRRHQTLRAAMDWSHGLLTDDQRAVFRRLGVFSGGFTMELAQAVCTDDARDEWAVLDQLAALVEKSLVVAEPCEPVRYRLLESPRAFAIERLAACDEAGTMLRRHAAAMLRFLRCADDGKLDSTLRTDEYAASVLPELDNLRAAYRWAAGEHGDRALAIGLAAHAGPLVDYSSEFAHWIVDQRPHVEAGVAEQATEARFWRAVAATNMLGTFTMREQFEAARRAIAAYRTLGLPRRLFTALRLAAVWARSLGDAEGAKAAMDEAGALMEPDWPAEFRIVELRFRAFACRETGDLRAAGVLYAEAVRLAQQAGDWRLEVMERTNGCDLLWQLGRHDEAAATMRELLAALERRPASDFERVELLDLLFGVLGEAGRIEEAAAAAREALPVMRRMPKFRFEPCAQLLCSLGRPNAAARVLGAQAALERSGRDARPFNEERIAQATLKALRAVLTDAEIAAEMALGAGLGSADVCALLAQALGVAGDAA